MRLLRDSRRFVVSGLDGDRQLVCSPTRAITPGRPGNLTGSEITATRATLTWSPPVSPRPLAGYRLYREATQVYSGAAAEFTDTGLSAASTVTYRVTAVDVDGVEGPASLPLTVTTLDNTPPPDPEPDPDLTDVVPPAKVTNLAAAAVGATGVRLTCDETTDLSGILEYRFLRDDELLATLAGDAAVAGVLTVEDQDLTPGRTYNYDVLAVDNAGNVSDPAQVSYTVPITAVWNAAVIGGPAIAGSVVEAADQVTLSCGGVDIWSTSDQFRFAYLECTGDFRIQARVASLTNSNEWAKAGVMLRESLAASSRFALMLMTPTAVRGATFHHRISTGGSSTPSGTQDATSTLPRYVRIERVGDTFTGYKSTDGITWTKHGNSVVIAMAPTVLFGLAVCSHNAAALATAVFDHISYQAIPADTTAPSVPTGLDVGAVASDRADGTWTASTDAESGVAGYRVYRDGAATPIATPTSPSFSDTGLAASTTYSYRVSAVDNVGNESAQCLAVAVTTPALAAQGPYVDPPIPPFDVVRGVPKSDVINLDDHHHSPSGKGFDYSRTDGNTLPAGITYALSGANNGTLTRTYDGSGSGASSVNVTIRGTERAPVTPPSNDAETNWSARLAAVGSNLIAKENFARYTTDDELYAAGAYASRPPRSEGDCKIYRGEVGGPAVLSGGQCLEIVTYDNAAQNGGNWTLRPRGTTPINDFYVTFSLALNRALLWWPRGGVDGGGKLFNLGEYGGGQVSLITPKYLGFPGLFINGAPGFKRFLALPWSSGLGEEFYQPSIWNGNTDYADSKEKSNQAFGPSRLQNADSRFDYGYKPEGSAVSNYLDERGFTVPNPDSLLSGAVPWREDDWVEIQLRYRQDANGDSDILKMFACARGGNFKKTHDLSGPNGPGAILDSSGNPLRLSTSSGNPGGVSVLTFLNYPTGATREPGYRPVQKLRVAEVIVSSAWIPPSGNLSQLEPA